VPDVLARTASMRAANLAGVKRLSPKGKLQMCENAHKVSFICLLLVSCLCVATVYGVAAT
jgi:hypothetical protein